ncbi:coiled-coil protein [Methanococcoides methylutens]|uniref:Phosphoserine phosphatase n=1 Tax=Methanococcoides methylutens MM1 TaxID=1434104 RepID=A0A0E3SRF5_METMT|nr:coiled-coil protein [Methanococcoides methylutens]AKB85491.1 Phosphoserine phosphatase [Methanococcoides methylutens MM1]
MLKELNTKRQDLKAASEEAKEKRNGLNAEASTLAAKRNELNKRTKELINEAQEYKKLRDENNEQVKENKAKRDEINAKANEVFAKVDALRTANNLTGPSIKDIRKDIDRLEFTQQTEVLSPSKEKELVNKITELRKLYVIKKDQLESNTELKNLLTEAQEIRDEASTFHNVLSEYAQKAQEYHDKMISTFKEADKMRAESDAAHKQFVEFQEKADEQHKLFIAAQKEIRDIDKEVRKIKKGEDTGGKKVASMEDVRKDAEDIFDKFKSGEKLTTENLMVLQKSGLL